MVNRIEGILVSAAYRRLGGVQMVRGYLATISYSGRVVGRVNLVLEWWLQKGG